MFLLCWEGDSATRVWWSLGNRNRWFNGCSNSCRILQLIHHSEGMDKSIFVPVFLYFLFFLSVCFTSHLASSVLLFVHDGFTAKLVNPLNPALNPICYLLALLAHHFLHVSRIRVKSLPLRLLMSYIYWAPILDVFRWHTTTHHSR